MCGSSTTKLSIGAFGETLTCPPSSGAVPTKNITCSEIHRSSVPSISSNTFPIGAA